MHTSIKTASRRDCVVVKHCRMSSMWQESVVCGRRKHILYICCLAVLTFECYRTVFLENRTSAVSFTTKKGSKEHVSCELKGIQLGGNDNGTAATSRFSAPLPWTCREEVSDEFFLRFVEFQILECPPTYSASSFQLQASTSQSRIMGYVGDRYAVKDGCGIYNASVAVMDGSSKNDVSVDLFWTSDHLHYSNRMEDIEDATHIKTLGLRKENVTALLSPERMGYLRHHLERIPLFPVRFHVEQNHSIPTLPDCATIPIRDWTPVGVFNEDQNGTTLKEDSAKPWPFRSSKCTFPKRNLTELSLKLAGLRIKFLGDSHGGYLMEEWRALMCPEMKSDAYFNLDYECPYRNNTFHVAHRFFRAVYTFKNGTIEGDMDGLSVNWRKGDTKSCRELLGLGLYNATILPIPTWPFVYETQEGLDSLLVAIRSMVENCRTRYPDLFEKHILLLQSTTAIDSIDLVDPDDPDRSWRGIHNYRIQVFTKTLESELGDLVDGIIPVFELTYARSVSVPTTDGKHLPKSSYAELINVQATAVMSAMKARGMKLTSGDLRWFVGQDLEWFETKTMFVSVAVVKRSNFLENCRH